MGNLTQDFFNIQQLPILGRHQLLELKHFLFYIKMDIQNLNIGHIFVLDINRSSGRIQMILVQIHFQLSLAQHVMQFQQQLQKITIIILQIMDYVQEV